MYRIIILTLLIFSCKSNTDSDATLNNSLKIEKSKAESVKDIGTTLQENNQPEFRDGVDFKILGGLKKIIEKSPGCR